MFDPYAGEKGSYSSPPPLPSWHVAGDFEIIMELPRGQHEIKFVINGETWRCHPDLETKRDSQVLPLPGAPSLHRHPCASAAP